MSICSVKQFIWKDESYFFDDFLHIKSEKILGKGSEASIELVFRTTEFQREALSSAVQAQNIEKMDVLMSQILFKPAAHRMIIPIESSSEPPEYICLNKIQAAHDPYFPEIMEIKLIVSDWSDATELGIDMTCFTEGSLFDKIVSSANMRTLLPYGWSAIEATMHLHELGIIHRDIKPENFLIREFSAVMIDFGFAFFKNERNLQDFYKISGSPDYAAPERYRGQFSEASDAFSLGMVLYHILRYADPSLEKNSFFAGLNKHWKNIGDNMLNGFSVLSGPDMDSRSGLISQMLQIDPLNRPSLDKVKDLWEGIMRLDYGFASIGPRWFSLARI